MHDTTAGGVTGDGGDPGDSLLYLLSRIWRDVVTIIVSFTAALLVPTDTGDSVTV